jgi:hypothetical protein
MQSSGILLAFGLVIPVMFFGTIGATTERRRKLLSFSVAFLVFGGCLFQAACGGSGNTSTGNGQTGTPAGAYVVTITGNANGMQHATSANFTIK